MHYGLKTGNRILLLKDDVIDVSIHMLGHYGRPLLLVYPKLSKSFELKLPKTLPFFLHISKLLQQKLSEIKCAR